MAWRGNLVCRWCRLIRMLPNIHKADGRMKTIEHNQRQRNVIQYFPQCVAIEFIPAYGRGKRWACVSEKWKIVIDDDINIPSIAYVCRFHGKCVEYPQRHVADCHEYDKFASRLLFTQRNGIRASAQPIDYERRLYEHLNYLAKGNANFERGFLCDGRHQRECGVHYERRDRNEQQDVVKFWHRMMVDVQFGGLQIRQHRGHDHHKNHTELEYVVDHDARVKVRSARNDWVSKLASQSRPRRISHSFSTPTNSKMTNTMVIINSIKPAKMPRKLEWQSAYTNECVL